MVGDWTGQGLDTIGVVNPSTETWYLRNENSAGAPDFTPFQYGAPGWTPVAGDWNGTGHSGIGVVNGANATWYLRNEVSGGGADAGTFQYGGGGWGFVVGDWDYPVLPQLAAGGEATVPSSAAPLDRRPAPVGSAGGPEPVGGGRREQGVAGAARFVAIHGRPVAGGLPGPERRDDGPGGNQRRRGGLRLVRGPDPFRTRRLSTALPSRAVRPPAGWTF